ncbi:MAG: hypothetical protein AAFX99_09505 [Myxococcota bacterium]
MQTFRTTHAAMALSLAMAFGLMACGDDDDSSGGGSTSNNTTGATSNNTTGTTSNSTTGTTSNSTTGDTSNGTTGDTSNGTTGDTSNGTTGNTSNGTTGSTSNGTTSFIIPVGECGEFEACGVGGGLQGSWSLDQFCLDLILDGEDEPPEDPLPQCEGESFGYGEVLIEDGRLDVNEDGTYRLEYLIEGSLLFDLPLDCLPPGAMCEAFGENLNENPDDPPWTCTTEAGMCACVSIIDTVEVQEGSWSDMNDIFVIEPDDPEEDPIGFQVCQDGLELTLYAMDPETGAEFQLEFTRQGPPIETGMCGAFAACGGDPVSAWQIAEFCTTIEGPPNADDPVPNCEGDTLEFGVELGGAANLAGDGTYSITTVFSTTGTFSAPLDCLPQDVGCEFWEGAFNEEADPDDPMWTCMADDAGCTCTVFTSETETDMGTWTDNGDNTLAFFEGEDPEADDFEFCVDTDRLTLYSPDGSDDGGPLQIEFNRVIGGD